MKKRRWQIFNKSSLNMSEVPDGVAGLVVIAPPFNDGQPYGDFVDKYPFEQYLTLMHRVIEESVRILNNSGIVIIEAADSIISDGYYVQLAGMLQDYALKEGLHLISRHINFIDSKGAIELPTHAETSYHNPITADENHSNCCQWLIFCKEAHHFIGGQIHYINYERPIHPDDHHCPFPDEISEQFLVRGKFKEGMTVVEPFMGTGRLGLKIIARGGYYFGYEIDTKTFLKTKCSFEAA